MSDQFISMYPWSGLPRDDKSSGGISKREVQELINEAIANLASKEYVDNKESSLNNKIDNVNTDLSEHLNTKAGIGQLGHVLTDRARTTENHSAVTDGLGRVLVGDVGGVSEPEVLQMINQSLNGYAKSADLDSVANRVTLVSTQLATHTGKVAGNGELGHIQSSYDYDASYINDFTIDSLGHVVHPEYGVDKTFVKVITPSDDATGHTDTEVIKNAIAEIGKGIIRFSPGIFYIRETIVPPKNVGFFGTIMGTANSPSNTSSYIGTIIKNVTDNDTFEVLNESTMICDIGLVGNITEDKAMYRLDDALSYSRGGYRTMKGGCGIRYGDPTLGVKSSLRATIDNVLCAGFSRCGILVCKNSWVTTFRNIDCQKCGVGIMFAEASDNMLNGFTCSNNGIGVIMHGAGNCKILCGKIYGSGSLYSIPLLPNQCAGLYMDTCVHCDIIGVECQETYGNEIHIYNSYGCTINSCTYDRKNATYTEAPFLQTQYGVEIEDSNGLSLCLHGNRRLCGMSLTNCRNVTLDCWLFGDSPTEIGGTINAVGCTNIKYISQGVNDV